MSLSLCVHCNMSCHGLLAVAEQKQMQNTNLSGLKATRHKHTGTNSTNNQCHLTRWIEAHSKIVIKIEDKASKEHDGALTVQKKKTRCTSSEKKKNWCHQMQIFTVSVWQKRKNKINSDRRGKKKNRERMRLIIISRAWNVGTLNIYLVEPKLSFGWQNRTSKHINNCRWPMKNIKSRSSETFWNIQHGHKFIFYWHFAWQAKPNLFSHTLTRLTRISQSINFITFTEWQKIQLTQVILRSFPSLRQPQVRMKKKMHWRQVHHILSGIFSSALLIRCVKNSTTMRYRAVIYFVAFWANFMWFDKRRL